MNVEEAISAVQKQLSEDRFHHSLRVREQAVKLAEIFDVDKYEVELAAVLHDYAKERSIAEMKRLIISHKLPKDLLDYDPKLWHGPVGAILVEQELGISNQNVLNAIKYHTTGRPYMSPLEMVVYVADYIEPARSFPGIEKVRQEAQKDIKNAALLMCRNTIDFLMKQNKTIYPDTFYTYNYLTTHV